MFTNIGHNEAQQGGAANISFFTIEPIVPNGVERAVLFCVPSYIQVLMGAPVCLSASPDVLLTRSVPPGERAGGVIAGGRGQARLSALPTAPPARTAAVVWHGREQQKDGAAADHLAPSRSDSGDGARGGLLVHLPHVALLRHHPLHRVALRRRGAHGDQQLWIARLRSTRLVLCAPGRPANTESREPAGHGHS